MKCIWVWTHGRNVVQLLSHVHILSEVKLNVIILSQVDSEHWHSLVLARDSDLGIIDDFVLYIWSFKDTQKALISNVSTIFIKLAADKEENKTKHLALSGIETKIHPPLTVKRAK